MKDHCEPLVRGVCHFVAVSSGIAPGLVGVRRVTVKESFRGVISENNLVCRCVLDLDTLKPLHDFRKAPRRCQTSVKPPPPSPLARSERSVPIGPPSSSAPGRHGFAERGR